MRFLDGLDEARLEYIKCLAAYQRDAGTPTPASGVWPAGASLDRLAALFSSCYEETPALVRDMREIQAKRDEPDPPSGCDP